MVWVPSDVSGIDSRVLDSSPVGEAAAAEALSLLGARGGAMLDARGVKGETTSSRWQRKPAAVHAAHRQLPVGVAA